MELKQWKLALDDAYALVDAYPTSSEGYDGFFFWEMIYLSFPFSPLSSRYHRVATVYARGGEVELALQVFNQGLKINPKDEQIAAELDLIRRQKIKEALDGKVAFANGQFKDAAALFTQAIDVRETRDEEEEAFSYN